MRSHRKGDAMHALKRQWSLNKYCVILVLVLVLLLSEIKINARCCYTTTTGKTCTCIQVVVGSSRRKDDAFFVPDIANTTVCAFSSEKIDIDIDTQLYPSISSSSFLPMLCHEQDQKRIHRCSSSSSNRGLAKIFFYICFIQHEGYSNARTISESDSL